MGLALVAEHSPGEIDMDDIPNDGRLWEIMKFNDIPLRVGQICQRSGESLIVLGQPSGKSCFGFFRTRAGDPSRLRARPLEDGEKLVNTVDRG